MAKVGNGICEFVSMEERFEKKIIGLLKKGIQKSCTNSIDWGKLSVSPLCENASFMSYERDRLGLNGEIKKVGSMCVPL